ncbi:oxygenase MpaB family protein [Mucilaginibacter aquaedulcis]|uniref:oxygenase MpaB family protein n=1 Tax=Mucilaginibacter aquaedulcis TaxID=1187081 RepID=UPI0025B37817|nr:oxygenase MpaB family protein [Mucilaginibacter aquaedulcis]MDN3546972.1 oxygenase MpaB family protein [Mucilaginibacter aquaedulcis]
MLYTGVFNDDFLNTQRMVCDPLADVFIQQIFKDTIQKQALFQKLSTLNFNEQIKEFAGFYPGHNFINEATALPQWANLKLMAAGSVFFAGHAKAIMNLLGLLSLPYCYAAANGAMVLYLSERLRSDADKRLRETGEFVWETMAPGAFDFGGKGFASILKVRLIHAAARHYVQKGGKWDITWGMPVNQEDMAGTNIAFSLIVIRGLRKLGYTVEPGEQEGFLHLWNVIGSLLGINQGLLPADIHAIRDLESAIRTRQFEASEQGQELMESLTALFSEAAKEAGQNPRDVLGLMKHLLGNEIAAILAIDTPELSQDKLRLIRMLSLWQDLKPGLKPQIAYKNAYHKLHR